MSSSYQSSRRGTWVNALIGAVVSVVLSFIPFSPVIGGAVAGYLEGGDRNQGLRVGAYSGAIAAIPFVLLAVGIITLGTFGFAVAPGDAVRMLIAILLVAALVIALIAAYTIGLGAVGGYVGVMLAERQNGRANQSVDTRLSTSETDSVR